MFNLLVSNSLKNRLFVLAAALVLVAYGIYVRRACRSTCSRTSIVRPSP